MVDLKILKEIEEYAAYGFYEAEAQGLPWPRNYGMAYRRLYEMMPVRVIDGRLIVPCESFYCGRDWYDGEHHCANSIVNVFHSIGLETLRNIADIKKEKYPQYSEEIEWLFADFSTRVVHPQYTHSNPDIETVIKHGFKYMKQEIEDSLAKAENDDERNFLLAMKDYAIGIDAYVEKIKAAIEEAYNNAEGEYKADLEYVYRASRNFFEEPADSFIAGLMDASLIWMLDGCDGIGRIDYPLADLYEKDITSGALPIELARKMLDELFNNFARMHGWNMQIGGYKPDGSSACSMLTNEILRTNIRNNKIIRPNLSFKMAKNTPKETLDLVMQGLASGNSKPAIYNDDLYIETLMKHIPDLPYEDAVMYGLGGCSEAMIPGMSNCESLAFQINLPKILEYAMFDGMDMKEHTQFGPHTGKFEDFDTFEKFYDAFKAQIKFFTEHITTVINDWIDKRKVSGDPRIMRSLFTRGCVENRKSFEAGGAKYNWTNISYDGPTIVTDSLAAVKKFVYDEKKLTPKQLITAIENNYEDESIRLMLASGPKFGNDNPYVADIAADILDYTWSEMLSHKINRGNGIFVPSVIIFATYEWTGSFVGATPNGRYAYTALNDCVGACPGCDKNGPTAHLNSVLRLPLYKAFGTPVLNLRFQRSMLMEEEGRDKVVKLIQTYFERGGMQVQVTSVDREILLAAQKVPHEYQDLIIRIGGYSEYFVRLPKQIQDSVIARTEISL